MGGAATVASVVSVLGSAYYTHKSASAEKKAARKANALAAEQNRLERENAEAALLEKQRQSKNLLAEQQSAYKAKLGASGLTTKSGSGQVVMNKMQKDYDMEDKYQIAQKNYTLAKLSNNLKQTNNRNLLTIERLRNNEAQSLLGSGRSLVSTGSKSED